MTLAPAPVPAPSDASATLDDRRSPPSWTGFGSPLTLGLAGRLVVFATTFFTALAHVRGRDGAVLSPSWNLLARWDGGWYQLIATHGYEFAADGRQHSVAFFPLFPMLARLVMHLGLPFGLAGALVNSVAFVCSLCLLYRWMRSAVGDRQARWAVAALALCPPSVTGSVAYTEGLYLLVTIACLYAASSGRFALAGVMGALVTACRIPGIVVMPVLAFEGWRQGRLKAGIAAAVGSSAGILAYASYLGLRFHHPLAFYTVLRAWGRPGMGIAIAGWFRIFTAGVALPAWQADAVLPGIFVFGGAYLLWRYRRDLPVSAVAFGGLSLALILLANNVDSTERYAFGTFPVAMAAGCYLASNQRRAWVLIVYSTVLMALLARGYVTATWMP